MQYAFGNDILLVSDKAKHILDEREKVEKMTMNKYEMIEKRLHENDVRSAVKNQNWEYVVNSITGYFKDTDSGKNGKIWEIVTKLYLNGYKGNSCIVSPKGKVDVTYKGNKLEIKSNCGQLDMESLFNMDYVCYTMYSEIDIYNPERGKVATPAEWYNMMDNIGLIRQAKKDRNGVRNTAIQSYKNSKKKTVQLANNLDEYITIKDWKDTVEPKR